MDRVSLQTHPTNFLTNTYLLFRSVDYRLIYNSLYVACACLSIVKRILSKNNGISSFLQIYLSKMTRKWYVNKCSLTENDNISTITIIQDLKIYFLCQKVPEALTVVFLLYLLPFLFCFDFGPVFPTVLPCVSSLHVFTCSVSFITFVWCFLFCLQMELVCVITTKDVVYTKCLMFTSLSSWEHHS